MTQPAGNLMLRVMPGKVGFRASPESLEQVVPFRQAGIVDDQLEHAVAIVPRNRNNV